MNRRISSKNTVTGKRNKKIGRSKKRNTGTTKNKKRRINSGGGGGGGGGGGIGGRRGILNSMQANTLPPHTTPELPRIDNEPLKSGITSPALN
ncbi:hypothetical protein E2C01_058862 [Portunus trituberculatus]|uniref:Uncharacterized protein n=1 Tax=Portunus trituberculatus TaxID=210409 RepID=A0A5B7H0Z4_PORTR|nr:hypothetical protein [Portunus trituberculatus]